MRHDLYSSSPYASTDFISGVVKAYSYYPSNVLQTGVCEMSDLGGRLGPINFSSDNVDHLQLCADYNMFLFSTNFWHNYRRCVT